MSKLGERLKPPFRHLRRSPMRESLSLPTNCSKSSDTPAASVLLPSSRSINDIVSSTSLVETSSVFATHTLAAVAAPFLGQPSSPDDVPATVPQPTPPSTTLTHVDGGMNYVAWAGLKAFAGVLSTSGGVFGPLKSAINFFAAHVKTFEAELETCEEYKNLRTGLDWLFHDLAGRFGESIPPGMRPSIVNIARGIEREIAFVRQKEHRHAFDRYAEAMQDIDQVLKCYRRIQTLLERLVLNANVNIWMLVDEQATHYRLDKLSPSHAAWYSSAESKELYRDECTPDTRVEVLERLQVWREEDASERMYWLNGMAGTGKTTLSYSLCKQLEAENRLAANFFCSRQIPSCRDVKCILPTIAYQFANFSYPFRYALSQILEQNPDVHTRRLSEQFAKLLLDPLREVQHSLPPGLVVVIEGLDECTNDRGVGEILDALFAHVSDLPIKFFLTSRPEPIIRSRMLRRIGDRKRFELHLHELDKSVVGDDIRRYLQAGLKRANPSVRDLDILTERSGVLFIYAATVVRYIGAYDFSRSADRLESVLRASTSSNSSDKEINALYNLILVAAFDDPGLDDREKNEMRLVLHTVLCAQEPLTVHILARVLGVKRDESVHAALNPLRSVLNIQQSNEGITTLHKSFPDYMSDSSRSGTFYCDAATHNAVLAQRCFDLMKIPQPPFNICGLESSYVLDQEVPDLPKRREQAISGELAYACRYWSAHLELAGAGRNLCNELHSFLSARLLLWMEIMNILQDLPPSGMKMLTLVNDLVKHPGYTTEIRELAEDAREFVDAFLSSPASQSTPHIYISALSFWPKERPVSKCYSGNIRSPIEPMGLVIQRRGSIPLTIYGVGSDIKCVAFSQDGSHIVAGSGDTTLRVWEASTGQIVGEPSRGHADAISSVAYSPNGNHIVSGSDDHTIRVWDIGETGLTSSLPFMGHSGGVCAVAYSHSGVYIVSGSNDRTIRIWDAKTRKQVRQPLKGHTYGVCSVAYSTDDSRIVSGSSDRTIRIWDASTGQTIGQPLEGHTRDINSVTYSPDSTRIISGSSDRTIRIWDAHTGHMIGKPLEGHTGAVNSVVCSPDGAQIVSGSSDRTIRVWDLRTGHMVGNYLKGHDGVVHSVAVACDRIVTASADSTIRIWATDSEQITCRPVKWYTGVVGQTACFVERPLLTSQDGDPAICVWDTKTGHIHCRQPHQSHPSIMTTPEHLDQAATSSTHTSFFNNDGWVVSGSSQRLIWVPVGVRDLIWHSRGAATVSEHNSLWLDLSTAFLGKKWHRCYQYTED